MFDVRSVTSRFANTANTMTAPGYTIAGLAVAYDVSRSAALTVRLRNLTDRVYAAAVTGTPMFFLGAPRTVDMTLRLRF